MKNKSTFLLALLAGLPVVLPGCADEPKEPPTIQPVGFHLERARDCSDLLSRLQADALVKMNDGIDQQLAWLDDPYYGDMSGNATSGTATSGAGGGSASPVDGADDGGGATGPNHSETNTQVDGVDEADIVKTDGNYLYVLHGDQLAIINALPASDMALASTTTIEGSPIEMFLADGRIVVYSRVNKNDLSGSTGGGVDDYYGYEPFVKLTVLSQTGTTSAVERELYFEGNYNTSRRVDAHVRTVLSGGHHLPELQYYPEQLWNDYYEDSHGWEYWDYPTSATLKAAYQQLRAANTQVIAKATLSDFVPQRFEKIDGSLTELAPSCADYHVPPAGSTSYGITQIQTIDLEAPNDAPAETQVVGWADTVYSNEGAMYLASTEWMDWSTQQELAQSETLVSYNKTILHKFDLSEAPAAPSYQASGKISGSLVNQFALDEKDGKLRAATTDSQGSWSAWRSVNHLFVLEQNGEALNVIGSVEDLAEDEQIYSARFVGDRGYMVTFRQVDPLFVIDLAEPTAPKVMAELKIPGFSEYMHPIGDTHLLTIGRDGTDDGQVLTPALQIFDVTDATAPKLTHKHVLAEGQSEAQYNHKAFTFYGNTLAIPFSSYSWNWDDESANQATLQLFDIDVDAGITALGAIDHASLIEQDQLDYCYYGPEMRRGVFIEDHIYSISTGGVKVNALSDLSETSALDLPDASYDYGCYGDQGWNEGWDEGF